MSFLIKFPYKSLSCVHKAKGRFPKVYSGDYKIQLRLEHQGVDALNSGGF